jgi:hypothetical protein
VGSRSRRCCSNAVILRRPQTSSLARARNPMDQRTATQPPNRQPDPDSAAAYGAIVAIPRERTSRPGPAPQPFCFFDVARSHSGRTARPVARCSSSLARPPSRSTDSSSVPRRTHARSQVPGMRSRWTSFHAALTSTAAAVKRQGGGLPCRCACLRSCFRRVSPAYEQQMGDEGRTPLIRPGQPPVISRWRRRACCSLARCTPSLMS